MALAGRAGLVQAFNLGSDARLRGSPLSCCPYRVKSSAWYYWRLGWYHTERYWGYDVRDRWRYRQLPAVIDLGRPYL